MQEVLEQQCFEGERALFMRKNLKILNSVFQNGESPLKECSDIELANTLFKWKYPMWYGKNFILNDCILFDTARAGIWYTDNITMKNCEIQAPKTFRRSTNIVLENVSMPNAEETLWSCDKIKLNNVSVHGNYLAMNASNMEVDNLHLSGNYVFDGAQNLVIRNSKLLTKDAFWNAKNVQVFDSYICGEYLGWNSENVTFVNCLIESNQGMCYMDKLKLVNCRLLNTTLAFEYSSVEASVSGMIDSIKNPIAGSIEADHIKEVIFDDPAIDPKRTNIITKD